MLRAFSSKLRTYGSKSVFQFLHLSSHRLKENGMQFLFLCADRIGFFWIYLNRVQIAVTPGRQTPCSCRRALARATCAGVSPPPCLIEGPRPRACPICCGCTMRLFLPSVQINRLPLNGAFFLSNYPIHGGWKGGDLRVCYFGIEASRNSHVDTSEMSVLCSTEILNNYLPAILLNYLFTHPPSHLSVRPCI